MARYNPSFDGLRAVAALIVLVLHSKAAFGQGGLAFGLDGLAFGLGGYVGVDVFFVLSGFLITSLLRSEAEATSKIDLADFWRRRMLRLYPALLFMLAAFLVIAPAGHRYEAALAGFYLTDIARSLNIDAMPNLAHTWSLSVEAQFYLVWPLALPFILKMKRPRLFLIALYALSVVLRMAGGWTGFGYTTHFGGLVLGSLITFLPPLNARWAWPALAVILACSMLPPVPHSTWALGPDISAAEVASAVLVSALTGPSLVSRALAWGPLVYLGKLSYAFYLWHLPIVHLIGARFPWYVVLPLTFVLAFAAAVASRYLVELPALRFRRRSTGANEAGAYGSSSISQ
jgi:peptidoglycan/LPS O-acetylase OafA/YrhL